MKQFKLKHFRILLSVLIFMFSAHYLKSQDYKDYNYYTTIARYQLNPDSSIHYYEKAFSLIDKPLLEHQVAILKKYVIVGNKKEIINRYKYLLEAGFTYEGIFESGFNSVSISENLSKELKAIKPPGLNLNLEFISEFSEYLGEDQFVRRYLSNDIKSDYMQMVDSMNHIRLKEYIELNGFPGESELGYYRNIPHLLIIHIISNESTKESWPNFYKPLLLGLANHGQVSYTFIASLEDRWHMIYDNYQIYGILIRRKGYQIGMTQEEYLKLPFELLVPIKDIENLDERRKNVGLPPFYIEAEFNKLELPENYNPKK